jgi:hypothetical protein
MAVVHRILRLSVLRQVACRCVRLRQETGCVVVRSNSAAEVSGADGVQSPAAASGRIGCLLALAFSRRDPWQRERGD